MTLLSTPKFESIIEEAHKRRSDGVPMEAIPLYRQALEIEPNDVRLYVWIGDVLREAGKNEEAIVHYRDAINLDPKSARAYVGLGHVKGAMGQVDEAIRCYKLASELDSLNKDHYEECIAMEQFKSRNKYPSANEHMVFKQAIRDELRWVYEGLHENLERVMHDDFPAYDGWDFSWKLLNKEFPWSCTDEEGSILYDIIKHNNLNFGFEIATAYGFSSTYIGNALKFNNGKLVTMDCYLEEMLEDFEYNDDDIEKLCKDKSFYDKAERSEGLVNARRLANKFELEEVIEFNVGLSPRDVSKCIDGRALDFVYIDGGHFGDQPLKDFEAVSGFLGEKCAVVFHDTWNNPAVRRAIEAAELVLGKRSVRLNTRYGLAVVGRGLSADTYKRVKALSFKYR